jgi:hypothetical protein
VSLETITVAGTVYEFTNDGSVSDPAYIPVLCSTGDEDAIMTAFVDAVSVYGGEGVHAAIDTGNANVMIAVPNGAVVDEDVAGCSRAALQTLSNIDIVTGSPKILLYDNDNKVLNSGSYSYWNDVSFYTPYVTDTGLKFAVIPFDSDGNDVVTTSLTSGESWSVEISDEAPGASFEYNMGMDGILRAMYPPVPLSGATLVVNGIEVESHAVHGEDAIWRAGTSGIYWYDNTPGGAPWADDWESQDSVGSYSVHTTLHLAYAKPGCSSIVTSLQPRAGSPIKVTRAGTVEDASDGDLELDIDLELSEESAGIEGYDVVKTTDGQKLLKGPVVSEVVAGPGISISSPPGVASGRGRVLISSDSAGAYSGDFSNIALRNARQELMGLFPYIELLPWDNGSSSNRESGFIASFVVPTTLQGEYKVYVDMTVFGLEDIDYVEGGANTKKYAGLTFDYGVLRDYSPSSDVNRTMIDNVVKPATGPMLVDIPFGYDGGIIYVDADGNNEAERVYKAYDPMIVHNNPSRSDEEGRILRVLPPAFPVTGDLIGNVASIDFSQVSVQAGSQVSIRVQRADASQEDDQYVGAVGFTQLKWSLTRVV